MNDIVRAGVIGWPIAHSRSPLIHRHWLAKYAIAGRYTKEAVKPGHLAGFLAGLADRGFAGVNVTVPHKEAVLALADHREPVAMAIGAANTLWFDGGRLYATNTDADGFMANLTQLAPEWRRGDGPVAVLGAGGAARAILYGFAQAGVGEIRLLNRTRSRAERLAEAFGPAVRVHDWGERERALGDVGVLVNATSLGMAGASELAIDLGALPDHAVVADIVYAPLETNLLRAARGRGLATVDGLGMLMHQAVPGFEKWFGVRPDVTPELRQALERDLGGNCTP